MPLKCKSFFRWLKQKTIDTCCCFFSKICDDLMPKFNQYPQILLDLNYDCLMEIFASMSPPDRMKFALASSHFSSAVIHFFNVDRFEFADYEKTFKLEDLSKILTKFGPCIRRMHLQFTYDTADRYYEKRFPKTCSNLEELTFSWLGNRNHATAQKVLTYTKNLTILNIEDYDLTDQICAVIGNLKCLKELNLAGNRHITGRGIEGLRNLTRLNLKRCERFDPANLIEICKVAKLKYLNICDCLRIDKDAFEHMVRTQTELLRIELNSVYPKTDTKLVAQLKGLQEIRIHSRCISGETDSNLLTELVKYRRNELACLEVYNFWVPVASRFRNEMRRLTLEFPNLKKLRMEVTHGSYDGDFDEYYLAELVRCCSHLEDLKIGGWRIPNSKKVFWLIGKLRRLQVLDLTFARGFDEEFYENAVNVVESRRSVPMLLYVLGTEFPRDFAETELYKRNRHLIKISFQSTYAYL